MEIREIIEKLNSKVASEEDLKSLEKRLDQYNTQLKEIEERRRLSKEFLERTYTL